MSAAAAAILDGMPDARDLHRLDSGGQTSVFAGSLQLFCFAEDDAGMRNIAAVTLRQLGFRGTAVAAVTGLTPNYVATMYQRFLREGTAGLVRQPGRPRETAAASWEQALTWRAAGVRDAEIARRLGVDQSTVLRRLGPAHPAGPLPFTPEPAPEREEEHAAGPEPALAADPEPAETAAPEPAETAAPEPAETAAPAQGGELRRAGVRSRYAGGMLLHAFLSRTAAGTVLGSVAAEPGDVALLTAVSMCFALGAATTEQFKHLDAAEAGPLAGFAVLPGLRALRPELARIADAADPQQVQSLFAAAMLPAPPVPPGVYYVDDPFVPYTGARPVAKG